MAYEADLEAWAREQTTKAGGYLLKWVSPGNMGVPDRILVLRGFTAFIEFKSPKGRLTPLQKVWQGRLDSHVVRTRAEFRLILMDAINAGR